jgi:hypothetical protein
VVAFPNHHVARQTAAAYATLQRLGVTAGAVMSNHHAEPDKYVTSQISLLLHSNLRWYLENIATDFYSAYDKWTEGLPVNWWFRDVKRGYWADPMDSVGVCPPSSPIPDRSSGFAIASPPTCRRFAGIGRSFTISASPLTESDPFQLTLCDPGSAQV